MTFTILSTILLLSVGIKTTTPSEAIRSLDNGLNAANTLNYNMQQNKELLGGDVSNTAKALATLTPRMKHLVGEVKNHEERALLAQQYNEVICCCL